MPPKKNEPEKIVMDRKWAMPNKNTFSIPPIRKLIERHLAKKVKKADSVWIDPFARDSVFNVQMTHTNDLNKTCNNTSQGRT
jgi:hypothetical protein